ncbi:MAG: TIGR00730 family Rossman fold protein [Desulfobacterales bacterium]|nr:TIGR00730 family Rossman fold protein [Desulfobacterales bacterium]
MKYICVYCGSNPGNQPEYTQMAKALAQTLVDHDLGLVYGGAKIGIMGTIADTVLEKGGEVIGVMPQSLVDREVAHPGLTRLEVVSSMHERKALMAKLSDGFIALPGGIGTLEEIFEVLTWAQLGFHRKPCGLLNVKGYYDHLTTFLDHVTEEGFVQPVHRAILMSESDPQTLITAFKDYQAPLTTTKWLGRK